MTEKQKAQEGSEMEQKLETETGAPQVSTEKSGQPPVKVEVDAETVSLQRAELERMQRALKDANAEAAKHRKALQALEAEKETQAQAELSEVDKLKAQLAKSAQQVDELNRQLQERALQDLRVSIAKKVGLPEKLASRLVGEDEDALEEDAKALLASIPKPTPPQEALKKNPGATPVNPGANGQPGLSDMQKFQQLMSSQNVAFDIEHARRRGGGVVYTENNTGTKE